VAGAWARHWQTLWPEDRSVRAPLERLLRAFREHRAQLAEAPEEASSQDSLQALARQFQVSFRRHPLSPTAAIAYLGLLAIDLRSCAAPSPCAHCAKHRVAAP